MVAALRGQPLKTLIRFVLITYLRYSINNQEDAPLGYFKRFVQLGPPVCVYACSHAYDHAYEYKYVCTLEEYVDD